MKYRYIPLFFLGLTLLVAACKNKSNPAGNEGSGTFSATPAGAINTDTIEPPLALIPVTQPVTIRGYFKFMDDLVRQYDSLAPYDLSEYLLVRANPWIIDTLENTDYYRQMARGNFVFDQRKMVVLKPGDTLRLPGPQTAAALSAKINNTRLDINIPAFRLRIVESDSILYDFPCRVGKNTEKFLAVTGHEVDLRTRSGTGEIIRINRAPVFTDPVTGERFKFTKRDDRKKTRMPVIPWLEPAIDGQRYGQMIHPTTNPKTLGRPASNGCIGLKEADAWRVYYYAPISTKVVIRYDLIEISPAGDTLRYEDVYRSTTGGKKAGIQVALFLLPKLANGCWCEP